MAIFQTLQSLIPGLRAAVNHDRAAHDASIQEKKLAPILNSTYPGSSLTNSSSDFLGDFRSVDSWMRFDMHRVRTRSRQLERSNPWAQSFKHSLLNNVLGARGMRLNMEITTSVIYGDAQEGALDEAANRIILDARNKFELARNFTTRKKLSRRAADRLLLSRLCFDGEIIQRRVPRFNNECKFSWQLIDPDYLDHNLNKLADNGNIIKMGVELDKDYKFPVAYWFFKRRPNDYFYADGPSSSVYVRVPAEEIRHIFIQDLDTEQTRGWPWIFAAAVNLFRMGKFEEAALVNAAIGASKMGFFKKTVPEGFVGDPQTELSDDGEIIDEVEPGQWVELPWNVEPVEFSPNYPDATFEPFIKAMLRGSSGSLGISYATFSNDYSDANFSSMRPAINEEREQWMNLQEFWIDEWKKPEFEEWLYYGLLSQTVRLPFLKFEKFNHPKFTGRRWGYVNPLQDVQTKQLELDNLLTAPSIIVEEQGGDWDLVRARIKRDTMQCEKDGISRIHSAFQYVDLETQQQVQKQPTEKPPEAKPKQKEE